MTGRPSPAQAALGRALGPLDGERVPGGCDKCNAYQTTGPAGDGIWKIVVHHDDHCPVLCEIERRHSL